MSQQKTTAVSNEQTEVPPVFDPNATVSDRLESLSLSLHEQRPVRARLGWLKGICLLCLVASAGIYYADTRGLISARELLSIGDNKNVPNVQGFVVARSSAEVLLSLSGVILPETKIDVTPLVPGPIVELPVSEGSVVRKGDLLAKILDTNYVADLHQAQASLSLTQSQLRELQAGTRPEEVERARALLASGEADLKMQQRSFERAKELHGRDAINESEFDVAEAQLSIAKATVARLKADLSLAEAGPRQEAIDAAAAEVSRAEAAIEKAQFFCDHARVLAPADGVILERNAELGEVSRSDYFLTSLCVIGDMSTVEVHVDVQERQLQRVRIGQPCRVIPDAYPDSVYEGTVKRIQPQVNRQRGVVRVAVAMDNPDQQLLSEMNARVDFLDATVLNAAEDVLPVPDQAVCIHDARTLVYRSDGGLVSSISVDVVGRAGSDDVTLVRSELKEKDIVLLLDDGLQLDEGARVNVEISNAVDAE